MADPLDATSAGALTLGGDLTLNRMGFGAMQLAGPGVWGPPTDPDEAAAVLRRAVELGVTHIDTSDFYGPATVNELIRSTLAPYPADLAIVTKVGARRSADKGWPHALGHDDLLAAVHENLDHLGLDALPVVNLRVGNVDGPGDGSVAEPFTTLAELQGEGLIRHLGVSNVTPAQLAEAQSIAPVVCVQNSYNVAQRVDDPLVDECESQGVAYVPFFPLGGFSPLQSSTLDEVAAEVGATSRQVALAWLLQRSDTVLLIPGTSSVRHLEDNVGAASLHLDDTAVARLDALAG